MGRGLLVTKEWGKARREEAQAEVGTGPKGVPLGIAAAVPGHEAPGVLWGVMLSVL